MGCSSYASTLVLSWSPIIPSSCTLVATDPAAYTHTHSLIVLPDGGGQMTWYLELTATLMHKFLQHGGQTHTQRVVMCLHMKSEKAAGRGEWTRPDNQSHLGEQEKRCACKKHFVALFNQIELIPLRARERIWKKRKEIRGEKKGGRRGEKGSIWTMVSNRKNTSPVMDAAL